jgi:hypothetical protein
MLVLAACSGEHEAALRAQAASVDPGADDSGAADAGEPQPDASPDAGTTHLRASTLLAPLRDAGLDVEALPPLEDLRKKQFMAMMDAFSASLGTTCAHCHPVVRDADGGVTNDFRAWTPNKHIAQRMYDDYVRGMRFRGGDLFCDTCHLGNPTFLDRSNRAKLGNWMRENFDGKLSTTADGFSANCATCHGDPFDPQFLTTWANGPDE